MNIKHFIYLVVALLITIHINNVLMFVDESNHTTASLNYTQDQAQSLLQERRIERLAKVEKEKQAKNETVVAPETNWIDKWTNYLTVNYPNSPIIGELDFIYQSLDDEKATKLLAISGTESSFGTKGFVATNCNNPFGYLYYGTSRRGCYSPKWNTIHNSIDRFITLERDGWLESDSFEGYCVTNCEHWNENYNYFISLGADH